MHVILLSGGSGKRLWPLSNDVRSKQFLKLFKRPDGEYESMIQRVYRQIKTADPGADVTVATAKAQVSALQNQLCGEADISIEPCRRDTFAAIVLATAYLHDVKGAGEEEAAVVCPVDPYVNDDYFETLKKLHAQAEKGEANLVLMGIAPAYPSEKYGYIIPASTGEVSGVSAFKEKPDRETAERYIARGGLWNGGVFAYRLSYVLDKAREIFGTAGHQELFSRYETLEKISFDYAVVEQEPSIQVVRFGGGWKDIGTWNTMAEEMSEPVLGRAALNDACENTTVINELNIPILCMGVKDAIIAASGDGILISDKVQSSYIKPYVDEITGPVMFAEKSWGSFTVLDVQKSGMTIRILLRAGTHIRYHSHERRDEVWTIISGEGRTIVDGMEQKVAPGDVITMQAGCRHTIIADTELKVIEVQMGEEISVHDKQVFPFPE